MQDFMTPEFIDLCRKIQDEIEPEVGMWVSFPIDEKQRPCLFTDESSVNYCRHYRAEHIVLVDIGWLARKLNELTYCFALGVNAISREKWLCNYRQDYFASSGSIYCNTPELACLKALLKIKGRD
jgi:hypothetical protein